MFFCQYLKIEQRKATISFLSKFGRPRVSVGVRNNCCCCCCYWCCCCCSCSFTARPGVYNSNLTHYLQRTRECKRTHALYVSWSIRILSVHQALDSIIGDYINIYSGNLPPLQALVAVYGQKWNKNNAHVTNDFIFI